MDSFHRLSNNFSAKKPSTFKIPTDFYYMNATGHMAIVPIVMVNVSSSELSVDLCVSIVYLLFNLKIMNDDFIAHQDRNLYPVGSRHGWRDAPTTASWWAHSRRNI
jgi:hypothetical protein